MNMANDDGIDPYGFVIAAVVGIFLAVYGCYEGVTAGTMLHWLLAGAGFVFIAWSVWQAWSKRKTRALRKVNEPPPPSERE